MSSPFLFSFTKRKIRNQQEDDYDIEEDDTLSSRTTGTLIPPHSPHHPVLGDDGKKHQGSCHLFHHVHKMRYFLYMIFVIAFYSTFVIVWQGQTTSKMFLVSTSSSTTTSINTTDDSFTKFLDHPDWYPSDRSDRFPSVEDRVKLYMSNYYLPPCNDTERIHYTYNFPHSVTLFTCDNKTIDTISTRVRGDKELVLNEDVLRSSKALTDYCSDAMKMVSIAKTITGQTSLSNMPPLISQFGDAESKLSEHLIPSMTKFRTATTKKEIEKVTNPASGLNCAAGFSGESRMKLRTLKGKDVYSSIIWPLEYDRHYGPIKSVKELDIPWEQKKNEAIWRGVMTGVLAREDHRKPFPERCDLLPRCRFVRDYMNTTTTGLNVGFSFQIAQNKIDRDYTYMIKGHMPLNKLMEYKVIVIIEGNDVSSGLKWALYSGSVVMMAPPTKTTFAMEELLVPWVHYVPLKPDLSDASEQLKWVLSHDEKAKRIAERATLFIHDLFFHEDSEEDNKRVLEEILSRYMKFFV